MSLLSEWFFIPTIESIIFKKDYHALEKSKLLFLPTSDDFKPPSIVFFSSFFQFLTVLKSVPNR